MPTFPRWAPASRWLNASRASSKANVRSMTGFRPLDSTARVKSSSAARSPTVMLRKLAPLDFSWKKSMPGFSVLRNPMEAISPPSATARSDWPIVPGPPTSTTRSTPRPPVSVRTLRPHSGSSA